MQACQKQRPMVRKEEWVGKIACVFEAVDFLLEAGV